eukprot:GILI01001231.1.p1 GENE.GILI01001231.1~~GILI01001231.1.p1  ORF type:complete len:650 (+),score=142.45 GILI01001231.1:63-2012(+)
MNSSSTTVFRHPPGLAPAIVAKWPLETSLPRNRDTNDSDSDSHKILFLNNQQHKLFDVEKELPLTAGGSSCTSITSAGCTADTVASAFNNASVISKYDPPIPSGADRMVLAERFKTKLCRAFERKEVCQYGYNCMFAHSEEEQRTVDMNIKDGIFTQEAIDKFRQSQRLAAEAHGQKVPQQQSPNLPLPQSSMAKRSTTQPKDIMASMSASLSSQPALPASPALPFAFNQLLPHQLQQQASPQQSVPQPQQQLSLQHQPPQSFSAFAHPPGVNPLLAGLQPSYQQHQAMMYLPPPPGRQGKGGRPPAHAQVPVTYATIVYTTVPIIMEAPLSKRKRKARIQEHKVRQEMWEEDQKRLNQEQQHRLTPPIEVTSLAEVGGAFSGQGIWRGVGEDDCGEAFGSGIDAAGMLSASIPLANASINSTSALIAENASSTSGSPMPARSHFREYTVDNDIVESYGQSAMQQVVDTPGADEPLTRGQKKQLRLREQIRLEQQKMKEAGITPSAPPSLPNFESTPPKPFPYAIPPQPTAPAGQQAYSQTYPCQYAPGMYADPSALGRHEHAPQLQQQPQIVLHAQLPHQQPYILNAQAPSYQQAPHQQPYPALSYYPYQGSTMGAGGSINGSYALQMHSNPMQYAFPQPMQQHLASK